jgi:DNA replication protein DnaC
LLTAEISEKQARPIKYQMTIAKLPLAKEIEEFDFEGRPEGRHRFKPDGRRGQRDPDPGSGDR